MIKGKKLLALGAAAALTLAACGDDDDDTSADTEAPADTEAAAESEAPADTEAMDEETTDTEAMDEETTDTEAMDEETMDDMDTGDSFLTLEQECESWGGLEAPEGYTVNLVTDIGKIDDGTFNQFAYEGMTAAVDCFGIENSSFIETVSEADYASNIATSLEADPAVLVTVGFLITTDTQEAAEANPDVSFVGIDQFLEEYPENMVGVLFNEQEGGFIAGAMAASLSESGTVGVVGGQEIPPVVKFVNGYEAGAAYVDDSVRVLSIYNESFNDPAKGASDANQFIGEGADVVFGAGGPTGSGGVLEATSQGVWGIGVDQDEYFTSFEGGSVPGAEYLATSAVKRVDLAVFRNIAAAIDGSFEGGIYTLSAANGGITYAPFHDADIPEDVAATVEEVRAGLADGSIDTGICGIDGLYLGEGSACD